MSTKGRASSASDKVTPAPVGKKPFDVQAWRVALDRYRDIPFMEDGRDQGIQSSESTWTEVDALRRGEDLPSEGGCDGLSARPMEGGRS